ncbi:MAG TPA: DUF5668 domain-containing protein [Candidatus Limnocylindria bacterium]|nr:DUF5668 domain-containing protein [Candidatus Limnocylindria bacterium]
MRVDRGLLSWGLVLILAGGIPLAVQAGIIDRSVAVQAWRLWPLVFVGAGIGLLLRGSRLAFVGGLVVAITVGLIGGGLLAGGGVDIGSVACGGGTAGGQSIERRGTFEGPSTVELDFRCGDLTVSSAAGSTWTAQIVSDRDRVPDIESSAASLSIDSGGRGEFFLPGFGSGPERWDVSLPRATEIALRLTMNAGRGTLDLREGRFASIDGTVNAGSLRLDLTGATPQRIGLTLNAGDVRMVLPASSLEGSWTVNAGSVHLCVPPEAGLRIRTNDSITASFDYARAGMVRDGTTWTSANFATATQRIELSTTANAGSFSLNPPEGCR